ncbi:MAG: leucine-rich repeat domain-containing protein, partial [Clostridia bacterium]|nr:leucine-rich repeat domain-containing protein [Clostridia bacterium]
MKKPLSVIALFLALILLLPVVSFAADAEADFQYVDYFGNSKTSGYTGPGGDIVIPWTLGGKFVIAVGQATFAACGTLTGVELPREATWIGAAAFSNCDALRSVTLDNNLEGIENDAFFGCTSLKTMIIPPHVDGIGERAFSRCTSLSRVTMRGAVKTIGKWAFSDCMSLESVTLPDTVELIRRDAFSGCTSLKKVYFAGSEEDWEKIRIDKGNDELLSAQIVYGHEEPKFGDVNYTSYFIDPVLWAVENGVTKGTIAKT